MKDLWIIKYRPKTIDGYVWKDEKQKSQILSMMKGGTLPHLLFSGGAGRGKTTLAYIMLNELNVVSGDILEINASLENSVDTVRTKILNFATSWGFGDMRYILLDEFDHFSANAQAMLRNLMETYHDSVRFILTCNFENKILDAIKSRCQHFHFAQLDRDEFTIRAATILAEEGINFSVELLDDYVRATYPDLRKCINLLQQNSVDGELLDIGNDETTTTDYMFDVVQHIKQGQVNQARTVLLQSARVEEYVDIFRFLYQNVDLWSKTEEKQNEAIILIAKHLRDHALVADPEINLASLLIQLGMLQE